MRSQPAPPALPSTARSTFGIGPSRSPPAPRPIADTVIAGSSRYSSTQVREPQLPFATMMYMDLTVRMVIVYAMPEEAKMQAVADIDQALQGERLQHRVAHSVPLAQIAHSHELIEQGGFRGCVVVDIGA